MEEKDYLKEGINAKLKERNSSVSVILRPSQQNVINKTSAFCTYHTNCQLINYFVNKKHTICI